MKTTSENHGYQVKIHYIPEDYLSDSGERLHNGGKVYRSRKTAVNIMSKLLIDIDAGFIRVDGFSHCEIVEWFA